jgi:GrpB protein
LPGVIVVAEYDPAWQRRFEQLRREYAPAMAAAGVQVVAIEHVGSTSVPGLAAKPVIDCIADLGEEHGHRVLRVCGKGTKIVLLPPHEPGPGRPPSGCG